MKVIKTERANWSMTELIMDQFASWGLKPKYLVEVGKSVSDCRGNTT